MTRRQARSPSLNPWRGFRGCKASSCCHSVRAKPLSCVILMLAAVQYSQATTQFIGVAKSVV